MPEILTGPARQGSTEPCGKCGHTKRDHSGRSDQTRKYKDDPWCHPCETECLFQTSAELVADFAHATATRYADLVRTVILHSPQDEWPNLINDLLLLHTELAGKYSTQLPAAEEISLRETTVEYVNDQALRAVHILGSLPPDFT